VKYCVLIMDGAAGLPLKERGGKTCLELADTPHLNAMASEGMMGMAKTVPDGMEPSSACACMSVIGYDPKIYYKGRASIEAKSMGIDVGEGETVFRCNFVTVEDGRMKDYSAGHISTEEAAKLIDTLDGKLGGDGVKFYPGVSYRHILKLKGREETMGAVCTPPHDIPNHPVAEYLPKGEGSEYLLELMQKSEKILKEHPVNKQRQKRKENAPTTIWLFWGTGKLPDMPPFISEYGLKSAMTSGVDLLKGLAIMVDMQVLEIAGVSDGPDNDYGAQIDGALDSLKDNDLVVVHMEAPDEASHGGSIEGKIKAIEDIDRKVVSRVRSWKGDNLRVLVMPDHPTPIITRTHSRDPVPFLLWGVGFDSNGAGRFTEAEAEATGFSVDEGCKIIGKLVAER